MLSVDPGTQIDVFHEFEIKKFIELIVIDFGRCRVLSLCVCGSVYRCSSIEEIALA